MTVRITIARITAFTLLLFALTTGLSSAAAGQADQQFIKIGIAYGGGAVSSCAFTCEGGFVFARAVSGGFDEILSLPECKQLTVKATASGIEADDDSGAAVFDAFDADTCVLPVSGIISFNGKPYRGGFCFYKPDSGRLNVINYIELESYLYGVINSEMGYGNPIEALKAQAVTARSFAVCNKGKHASDGFDLCCDVHCQVYKGYDDEHSETNQAVDETAGLFLTYEGVPVSGYYFKNSGGHTQSISDVWGGDAPYLTGVKDEYSPDYAWSYEMTFQEAASKLGASGYNIGNIKSVSIKGRNTSGAVSAIEIKGTAGTVELKAENIRTVFGSANIKSLLFSFQSAGGIPPGSDTSVKPALSNGEANEFPNGDDIINVAGAGGVIEKVKLNDIYVYPGNLLSKPATPQAVEDQTETVTGGTLMFYGKGYGHGVGMPQDSAIAMARQGFTFDEILKYFYTGIEIE